MFKGNAVNFIVHSPHRSTFSATWFATDGEIIGDFLLLFLQQTVTLEENRVLVDIIHRFIGSHLSDVINERSKGFFFYWKEMVSLCWPRPWNETIWPRLYEEYRNRFRNSFMLDVSVLMLTGRNHSSAGIWSPETRDCWCFSDSRSGYNSVWDKGAKVDEHEGRQSLPCTVCHPAKREQEKTWQSSLHYDLHVNKCSVKMLTYHSNLEHVRMRSVHWEPQSFPWAGCDCRSSQWGLSFGKTKVSPVAPTVAPLVVFLAADCFILISDINSLLDTSASCRMFLIIFRCYKVESCHQVL